jgi:hypothetical protein
MKKQRVTTEIDDSGYPDSVPAGALFVAADEPLLVYPSTVAAERDLEAIDVRNGIYRAAYGPNGEPYRITTEGERVMVQRSDGPTKPEALRALLANFVAATGGHVEAAMPLDELVAEVWAIHRDFWREHDPYGERFGYPIPLWGCAAGLVGVALALYFLLH